MNKLTLLLSLPIVALALTGMSRAPEENSTLKAEIAPLESPGKHKHRKDYVKPHADINMQFSAPARLQVGETVTIPLGFHMYQQVDQLRIDIPSVSGVQLNSASHYEFTDAKQVTFDLQVSVLQQGRFNLNVNAVITRDGQQQARSFIIPLIVGEQPDSKALPEEAGYKSNPSQGVISMPAVETTD